MSDAGTPQTPRPQAQQQTGQQLRQQTQPRAAQAEIERLPENVRNSTGAQRIRGEVQSTRDGVTRIQTREGEVRVRLPEGQRPAQGRAVEIELGQGRAREQAIVRLQARQAQIEASLARQRQPLPEPASREPAPREQPIRSDTARPTDAQPQSRSLGQRITLSRELAQSLSRARQASFNSQPQNVTRGQPVRLIALDTTQSAQFLRQLPNSVQIRLTTAQLASLLDAQQGQTQDTTPTNATLQTQSASSRVVPRIGALITALQATTSQNTGTQSGTPAQLLTTQLVPQIASSSADTAQLSITTARADAQSALPNTIGNAFTLKAIGTQNGILTTSHAATLQSQGISALQQQGAGQQTGQQTGQIDARFIGQHSLSVTLKTGGDRAITSLSAGTQTGGNSASGLTARIGVNTAHQLINTQISATTGFTPQSGALTGQVVGQTQQGLPVLQMNLPGAPNTQQLFTLQFGAGNLASGQQASFTTAATGSGGMTGAQTNAQTSLLGLSTGQLISLPASTGTQGLFSGVIDPMAGMNLANDLNDAIQTLQASGNARMAQNLQAMIPNAANSQQLTPAAMLFVSAVRGGDLSGWLGDRTIEMLRRAGRGELANRLTGASAGSMGTGSAVDSGGGEWRSLHLPFAWQEEIHAARLYYRQSGQDGGQDNQDGQNKQTRFIFDLTLSRMGAVQLDGLFKEKKLDLVVRTQERLSSAMRQHIRYNYTHALEASGLHGEVRFQNAPGSWVMFQPSSGEQNTAYQDLS